jgi:hypothetical protein
MDMGRANVGAMPGVLFPANPLAARLPHIAPREARCLAHSLNDLRW